MPGPDYNRIGLQGLRGGLRLALQGRDKTAPLMALTRELMIPGPGGDLPARLYIPIVCDTPGPGLVFFHGGGFVLGDLESHDAMCRRLAHSAEMTMISVEYRLAPEAPFPAQIEDGEAAALWVSGMAGDLGIDPGRLMLGGDSAGGYIAASVAETLNARAARTIVGQLLIYPLLQVDDDAWASSLFTDSRLIGRLAVGYIRSQLARGDLAFPSLLDAGLSPLPTVIATGGLLDPCRPDAQTYGRRMAALGAEVTMLDYPALVHGFGNLTHVSASARKAMAEIGSACRALF